MDQCSVEVYHSFLNLPCWAKHCLIWMHHHQILLSSLIASFAAFMTIKYIRKQINQNKVFRAEDEKKELQIHVMIFEAEYSEITNNILEYYRRIKNSIPNGFAEPLWTVTPYLFELEEEYLTFSASSYQLFMSSSDGELLSFLFELKTCRNRLAAANKYWNNTKRKSEDVFKETSTVDPITGRIKFRFDSSNLKHQRYAFQAETLLKSNISNAEKQIRDILEFESKFKAFFSEKLDAPNYEGFTLKKEYVTWFKENSSDV